jgi:hypothetical protein
MDTFFSWIMVAAVVCCCSLDYGTLADRSRRLFRTKRTTTIPLNPPTQAVREYEDESLSAFSGPDILRGYDSPEVRRADTLIRIRLFIAIGKHPVHR